MSKYWDNPEKFRDRVRSLYRKDRNYYFRKDLRKNYGITLEQYEEMTRRQSGLCALCGKPPSGAKSRIHGTPPRLHVDHDHVTGRVRGLLCTHCNTGLGCVEKSGVSLRRIADYLEVSYV